jgi:hypothetical protein
MTPYQFGYLLKQAMDSAPAAPAAPPKFPHTYSSMSTGNTNGTMVGSYYGKMPVEIRRPEAATGRRGDARVTADLAEAANRAAGNKSVPSSAGFGPTVILGPARGYGNNSAFGNENAAAHIRGVGNAALKGQPQPQLPPSAPPKPAGSWWPFGK